MLWLLLALQQAPLPTVGDTVWVVRTHPLPGDVLIRPRPITATPAVEPLGSPEVVQSGGEVRLRYPLVVWRPGRHQVEVPGPILVRRDGWSDTLRPTFAVIEVASVLPARSRDSLAPQPAFDILPRTSPSPLPVIVLLGLVALPLVPLHWWWRRRGPAPPHRPAPRPPLTEAERLQRWVLLGEARAAAEGWHQLVVHRAGPEPDEPTRRLLARLRAARYEPHAVDDAAAACAAAADWYAARGPV